MAERAYTTGALLAASLVLVGVSAVESYGEVAPYFVSGFSTERRFLAISGDGYHAGRSLLSKDMILRDCLDVARTIYARAQPTARRTEFLRRCDDEAKSISLAMPAYTYPWLVQASVAAELGRFDDFTKALHRATYTAPNAHWAAVRRIELAEANLDGLDREAVVAYERDLRTLLDSDAGTRVLAQHYVRRPELQQQLTAIAETAPPELQRRFFNLVKQQASAR